MRENALSSISTESGKLNLIGLAPDSLAKFFVGLGEKPYRVKQIMRWLYQRVVLEFDEIPALSLRLRSQLNLVATMSLPKVIRIDHARDGTLKWVLDVGAGQAVEAVYIPEPNRSTLCISSQAGCAMDCSFCATGRRGFNRNLSAAEILGQVIIANQELAPESSITNIVFMGMGEPLANYREVVQVTKLLIDDHAMGLSRRRVTISTSGLVPQIRKLAHDCNVALAVSLHAPTDDLRDKLVPINQRHRINELLEACWNYSESVASRHITFEYVMLAGVNDGVQDAISLIKLLKNRPAKVNLIPFNSFPGTQYTCSEADVIRRFCMKLRASGIVATIRRTRGDDISAACGQLAGQVKNRMLVRLGNRKIRAAL